MTALATLLGVPFRAGINGLRRPGALSLARWGFLGIVGTVVLGLVFGLLAMVFAYFFKQPVIGPLLVSRMFSMALLTFFFMLVYSNIMASLSSHYLSRDLPLLFALPIRPLAIFAAKAAEAVVGSSWMVVMMCVPLYAAYGVVRHAPPEFYLLAPLATVPFLLIPAALSMALNAGLIYLFPVQRMREIMLFFGTIAFTGSVVAFRLMEPEKLVTQGDEMKIFEFMKLLAAPSAPWLPSAWAAGAVVAAGNLANDPLAYWLHSLLLWGGAAAAWLAALAVAHRTYLPAWQHARESMGVRRGVRLATRWLPQGVGPYAAIVLKDLKVFVREPAQWGQVLLLSSLVLIYVFNIAKIPKEIATGLRSLLFFLNLGFIGLILTAVAARFLFPMVSLEGRTFAVLRLAPISMRRYLWARGAAGSAPLFLLAGALVALSAPMLGVDRFMSGVAALTMLAITLAVSALAVGCGAIFAKFSISNPEEIVTSLGGFVFMALSMLFIVVVLWLESQPVRVYYYAELFRKPFTSGGMAAGVGVVVAGLTLVVVRGAVGAGARSLAGRDL